MNIFIIIIPLLIISIPVVFAEPSNVGTIYWKQEIISSILLLIFMFMMMI